MNDETLKYYIALQEKFREVMGEWVFRDIGYHPEYGLGVIDIYDLFHFSDKYSLNTECSTKLIRLPLLIDPRNPERGLLGMMDKTKYRIDLHHLGATVTRMYGRDTSFDMKTYSSPELALLRALAHQWNVEVEG